MQTTQIHARRAALQIGCALTLLLAMLPGSSRAAFGWGFTYQGELNQSGSPVNGTADLSFTLFTAAVGGLQVGSTIVANGTSVTDGRFTVELDFTQGGIVPGIFDGNERYLEIAANGNTLSPRQHLTVTPHAAVASILALPCAIQTTAPGAFTIVSQSQAAQVRVIRAETQSDAIGAIAVMGQAYNTNGNENVGVYGESNSSNGFGVTGVNLSPVGNCTAVYGQNYSDAGIGVFGQNSSPTGTTFGVRGKVASSDGWAGYFEGRSWFQSKVGIRTVGDPQAMLDIQSGDPATGWALKVNDELYVDHLNNFVGVNRANRIGAEWFGVRAPVTGNNYGGMYVETSSATGKPFYGYANNGAAEVWTEFDGSLNQWAVVTPAFLNPAERLTVNTSTGNVAVKRSATTNDFEVEGTASKTTAGSWLANSDARIKTEVETVENALATLDKVRLVSFEYTDDYRLAHPEIEDRRYLNVIAQEFQQVFPEHVKGSGERLADGSEILQVDTYPLTIYSAAAIQQLHAQLQQKDLELASLRERLARIEAAVAVLAPAGEQLRTAGVAPTAAPVNLSDPATR